MQKPLNKMTFQIKPKLLPIMARQMERLYQSIHSWATEMENIKSWMNRITAAWKISIFHCLHLPFCLSCHWTCSEFFASWKLSSLALISHYAVSMMSKLWPVLHLSTDFVHCCNLGLYSIISYYWLCGCSLVTMMSKASMILHSADQLVTQLDPFLELDWWAISSFWMGCFQGCFLALLRYLPLEGAASAQEICLGPEHLFCTSFH